MRPVINVVLPDFPWLVRRVTLSRAISPCQSHSVSEAVSGASSCDGKRGTSGVTTQGRILGVAIIPPIELCFFRSNCFLPTELCFFRSSYVSSDRVGFTFGRGGAGAPGRK